MVLLRPAFSRTKTFIWFAIVVAGLAVRTDSLGVTSIVRALKLHPRLYTTLCKSFHSTGVHLNRLTRLWAQVALRLFPQPLRVNGLSDAHTTSGLKIGASAESVVRTLGKPLVIHACGMARYEYSDDKDPDAEQNDLDFTIRNGRVIEIAHTSWG